MHVLEEGERCEMDDGYQGSALMYAKCPGVGVIEADPEKAEMQQRVRNRQETVNKRFKKLGNFIHPLLPPVA